MLSAIITALDQRILSDTRLVSSVFAELISAQRELGLVFGDRPTCPFLRPHIVTRSAYEKVSQAATTVATAMEKILARALDDDELLRLLAPTTSELKMARIDPGYRTLCVSSRLDAYVSADGFQFLEYNAETPAGVGDQMQLDKVLSMLAHIQDLLAGHPHWQPSPHRRLLQALIEAYRQWGGAEARPQIAIVDWKGVATESEFHVLRDYFAAAGHAAIIADPRELSYDGEWLWRGDFRIDIVYKRVIIHEFLERCGEAHPLARAYADQRVCVVNSFRSKLPHKKATFAVLSDPHYADLFTDVELDVFRRHIPWTRYVKPGATEFHNSASELISLIRRDQHRFVLKPNDDYGGHGVFIGWEATATEWEQAIQIALTRPYVVQERRRPAFPCSLTTSGCRKCLSISIRSYFIIRLKVL